MSLASLLQNSPTLFISLTGILGLMLGSFLNVVIYRLPIMMEKSWRKQCHEFLEMDQPEADQETFNLVLPASRCPHCQTPIRPYQNIPVISYLLLRGKCAHCHAPIAMRYPIIEACTGMASAIVAWRFGFGYETLFALLLTWSLIALSAIDIDHHLLPDDITLPMLWLGLLLSLFSLYTTPEASIIGAIAGYMSLWTIYQAFKLLTGKEGMGYGDFKLLALFGAWLGWQLLPVIILLSSLVGAVVGITMIVFMQHDHSKPIPFGPYLAAAGWLAMLWGDRINQLYLQYTGM